MAPPTLSPGESGGDLAAKNLNHMEAGERSLVRFSDHWNNVDVRGVLYACQWRVCAYCGRPLPGNDRGDVEHFRPKSSVKEAPDHGGYWWLAFELDNYVLSCRVCNTARKSNRFPMRSSAKHYGYDRKHRLAAEARALFDPSRDPIDDWLWVDLDDLVLMPVRATEGLSRTKTRQVNASIKFFRLNVDQHLVEGRLAMLDRFMAALDDGREADATALAIRYNPQSLVARTFLVEHRPDLLPTPSEELRWLVDRMLDRLDRLMAILAATGEERRSEMELKETYWSLAALLSDPPAGEAQWLNDTFADHLILQEVEDRAARL